MLPQEWTRASRRCPFSGLEPALAEALRAYAERHNLGDLAQSPVVCGETTSTKTTSRFLGLAKSTEVVKSALVVSPPWIVWAIQKQGETATALGARLQQVEVAAYKPTLIDDHGLEVRGLPSAEGRAGTTFLPLGRDVDGAEMLRIALQTWASAEKR